MRKGLLTSVFLSIFLLVSCSSDDGGNNPCRTCSFELLGIVASSEYCDNGDGTADVTTDGETETVDLDGADFQQFISALEQTGFECN